MPRARNLPGGLSAFVWEPRFRIGLLFGGAKADDLWQWDEGPGLWTQLDRALGRSWPPPREFAGLCLDRHGGRLMLFCGRTLVGADVAPKTACAARPLLALAQE